MLWRGEWYHQYAPGWNPAYASWIWRRLEIDLLPWLGKRPLQQLEAPELLACPQRIQARGALETAHRALQTLSLVFRYGVATGRAQRDPAAALRGALPPVRVKHFAAITDPKTIGMLLRDLDGYEGSFVTRCAPHNWRRCCSCNPANCGKPSGRNSTWIPRNGGYPLTR